MKQFKTTKILRFCATLSACALIAPLALKADQSDPSSVVKKSTQLNPKTTPKTHAATHVSKNVQIPQAQPSVKSPATASKPSPTAHIWNLQNADIKSVINEVARETGKNFLIDPRVTGQVNLISTKPLSPKALYSVFLAMLNTYGFSAIPGNHVTRIVPNITAPQNPTPVSKLNHPASGAQVVVRVIPVGHVSSTQLVPILRPLLPQWSTVAAYPPSNLLILSGSANNLKRIARIVKQIDVVSNNAVSILPLKNASAKQVLKILKGLQSSTQTGGGSTAQVAIDADTRTNSIILSGNESERLRLSVIVTQLDAPSTKGKGNTQVVFLHYLSAKKLAPILNKIATGKGGSDTASDTTASTPSSSVSTSATTATNTNSSTNTNTSNDSVDISNLSAVLPEIDDNALIITANKGLMQNLKSIIQQLDVRPEQVYVQAIIVELDSSSMQKLGFQWGTFMGSSDSNSGNSSITGDSSSGVSNGNFQGGTGVGVIRNGHFSALVAAIKGLSGANILSEPTIMVQNNQKATFSVGKQISVQDSQQGSLDNTDTNGVPNTYTTFKQEDVGLKLTVTPQINHGQSVQLAINQQNGSLQNPDNPGTTPIINKSDIKTNVLVNNGDILVLGGLMSNNMTTSTYKTPILGDIPLIGHLFSYTSHQLEKKDLMIFLRPVIVKTALDGTNITDKKYQYIRNLQLNWRYNAAEKDTPNARLLPPRDRDLPLPVPFTES